MSKQLTSIVFFNSNEQNSVASLLASVKDQPNAEIELIALNASGSKMNIDTPFPQTVIDVDLENETLGSTLNKAFKAANGSYTMLIDNRTTPISLKRGAIDLFILGLARDARSGMVYADYDLEKDGETKEVKLLKHHIGRVRDNQDFGKLFFFKTEALKAINYADASIKFNTLYDLRLRVSQQHSLSHLANRYSGSLYSVQAEAKSQNVFDYLLASKESQLEAENVLSAHLKSIGAYLEPGMHYGPRPQTESSATLKASVIIPVNNRPDFIAQAIESVQAQTVKEVEVVVVVNGGENDPTIASVKKYMEGGEKFDAAKPGVQLLVYDINNLGLCLNMGAHYAKGAYYVQLDSDDRLKADAVEKILAVYDEDPKIGMVIGSYEVWEKQADGSITRMEDLPVVTHDEWTEDNGRNNLLRINGAGAPRSIPMELIRTVGFSVNEEPYCRNYGEDYGMVLKLSEKHRIGRVWDAIYEVIRHSGGTDHSIDQITIDRNDEAKDFMREETILRRIKLNK